MRYTPRATARERNAGKATEYTRATWSFSSVFDSIKLIAVPTHASTIATAQSSSGARPTSRPRVITSRALYISQLRQLREDIAAESEFVVAARAVHRIPSALAA